MLRKLLLLLTLALRSRSGIAIAALLAVLPMMVREPSCGHDFDFHLLSWLEASQQFAQGSFPHWAYTPAFNAGEPRFIFYPPLSWSLGAILGLILPWTLVPAAFTWIALTLSGLTFHALARRYTSSPTAALGAVLYLANPYMLFTAYERSAFAELLAAAWLPLLIAAALAARPRVLPTALPVALLWLTNAPAAVMATYALAFLTIIRLLPGARSFQFQRKGQISSEARPLSSPGPVLPPAPSVEPHAMSGNRKLQSRLHLALTTTAGTALGLSLAAFYILPAAYERRFVQIQMLVVEGMRVSDHFLFHHMPGATPDDRFHDAVVRTASIIALVLLTAIATALLSLALNLRSFRPKRGIVSSFLAKWKNPRTALSTTAETILPQALLALLIAFLLTPISLPVWTHLPDLAFLQFPWRLNAILGLIFAFFTTLALPRKPPFPSSLLPLLCFVIAALLIAPAWHLFHQHCDPEDSVPVRVALFHSQQGTDPTDEYTPLDADPDALHPNDPPYWLFPAPADSSQAGSAVDTPPPAAASPGPAPHHLTLTISAPEYLVLNLREYPAWHVYLNHTLLPPTAAPRRLHREDGLLVLLLPPGTYTIDLALSRTPDETLGLSISAVALLLALYFYVKPRGSARAPSPSGTSLATPT